MAQEYTYDDEGDTWPFFVLAVLSFVLLPLTATWFFNVVLENDPDSINKRIIGAFSTTPVSNQEWKQKFQKTKRSSKIFNKKLLFVIIGWLTVAYVGQNFAREADLSNAFDPYTILDVTVMTSESEIKKKYKRLSLKFHPDKLPRDLTDEERAAKEEEFVIMNSAYKALTDPVTKENFKRYGHPDGPQEVKHGIAIPKFLVEGKYSPIMVIIYFLLIGGLLPAIVGSWWNDVKTHTKKGLHIETAAEFARKLADRNPATVITPSTILDWIMETHELKKFTNPKQKTLNYLQRKFDDDDSQFIVAQIPSLISGLVDIALVFKQTEIVLAAYDLQKSIAAAVPINGKFHALEQLPEVDFKAIGKQSEIRSIGKLLSVDRKTQEQTLGIEGEKLDNAINFAKSIPYLRVLEAKFEVPGEKLVPPGATAHIVVRFLAKASYHKSCPEIEDDDERLQSPSESMEFLRNPLITNESQPALPFATTPYFPESFRLGWNAVVISQDNNKIAEGATTSQKLERFDLSNLKLTQEQYVKDDGLVVSSFRIPYTVPTQGNEGTYHYRIVLKNNAYFGCDADIPFKVEVKTPPVKIFNNKKEKRALIGKRDDEESSEEEEDSDSDILDPEEDSIAGTLAALRGDHVKKSSKIEEIASDEEEEEVFTDINTDTEDEGDGE